MRGSYRLESECLKAFLDTGTHNRIVIHNKDS
jgi:hypothetical protein